MATQQYIQNIMHSECLESKIIIDRLDLSNAKLGKYLGEGTFGTVHEICIEGVCNCAVKNNLLNKMAMSSDWIDNENIDLEGWVDTIRLVDRFPNIFPKIYHASICHEYALDKDDPAIYDAIDDDDDQLGMKLGISVWAI